MMDNKERIKTENWIKKHSNEITIIGGGILLLARTILAMKGLKTGHRVKIGAPEKEFALNAVKSIGNTVKEQGPEIVKNAERYIVQMKAFNSGEWYNKTLTNSVSAAYSVANTCNWGRATRVVDTLTGVVRDVFPGDPSIYLEYGTKL